MTPKNPQTSQEVGDTDRLAALHAAVEKFLYDLGGAEEPGVVQARRTRLYDIASIAAGVALAATPAPLDVKRLARALHAVEPYAGENNCEVNYHADDAAAIAAAYAEEPT